MHLSPLKIKPKGDKDLSCISLYPFQVLIINWFIMFVNQTQAQADLRYFLLVVTNHILWWPSVQTYGLQLGKPDYKGDAQIISSLRLGTIHLLLGAHDPKRTFKAFPAALPTAPHVALLLKRGCSSLNQGQLRSKITFIVSDCKKPWVVLLYGVK